MNPYVIYGIYHVDTPEHIRYGGQTTVGLEKRKRGHLSAARTGSTLLSSTWIRDNGENVRFRVLAEAEDRNELNDLEIFWIAHLKAVGQAELNLLPGGGNSPRDWVPSDELRKRWSDQRRYGGVASTKLSVDEVLEIRMLSAQGFPDKEIASLFEGGVQCVGHILRGESWGYLPWAEGTAPRNNPARPQITVQEWDEICTGLASGKSVNSMAEKVGVSRTTINRYTRDPEVRHKYGLDQPEVLEMRKRVKYLLSSQSLQGSNSREAGMDEGTVEKIKLLLWAGYSQREVANHFGVTQASVNLLSSGRSWRHVPWPIGPKRKPKGKKLIWSEAALELIN